MEAAPIVAELVGALVVIDAAVDELGRLGLGRTIAVLLPEVLLIDGDGREAIGDAEGGHDGTRDREVLGLEDGLPLDTVRVLAHILLGEEEGHLGGDIGGVDAEGWALGQLP